MGWQSICWSTDIAAFPLLWWADNAYLIADNADTLAAMAADLETQLALPGLRFGAASLEAMGNTLEITIRNDEAPLTQTSRVQVTIAISFPADVDLAEAHRRQCAYAAFWRDGHVLCDVRRPFAGRLRRFCVNTVAVYLFSAGGWVLGEALRPTC